MPVAAVILVGRPSVKSASSTAQSGSNCRATTPFFSLAPVVTMAIGVTLDPVPGGGGHQRQGRALAATHVDAINLFKALRVAYQESHQLGHIHGTAAAEPDDAVNLVFSGMGHRL